MNLNREKSVKLSNIKPNPDNPRVIKDLAFEKLCQSIKDFPKMLELRPMVTDVNGVVLGGNMRLKALQHLGFKEIPDTWVKRADQLTEEEKRRFIIADNVSGGEWDWEELQQNWDVDELDSWGLDVPDFRPESEQKDLSGDLKETFEVIISCTDEKHQEQIYNKLIAEGHECRVLTL